MQTTIMMKMKLYILILVMSCDFLNCSAIENEIGVAETDALKTFPEESASPTMSIKNDATSTASIAKDKRQINAKDTEIYPNHRSLTAGDDPEDGQETIYGPKPNQFLIRPMMVPPQQTQQQQQTGEPHQQTQLRNYPVTIRPHSQQLLEQSQEIQHFAYLQELNHNYPKASPAVPRSEKHQHIKSIPATRPMPPTQRPPTATTSVAEEAEQRYAYAVQTPLSQPHLRHFKPSVPYQIADAPPPQQQQQQQQLRLHRQQQQQFQVIPEEQFLKLIEEELQARAYQEAQPQYQQQPQQLHQRQYAPRLAPSHLNSINKIHPSDLTDVPIPVGLGNYRQRISEDPNGGPIQYIPNHQGGPKYLPLPNSQQHLPGEPSTAPVPPRLVRFKPTHLTYKSSLPNHPLAKSSLEKEIEKLLAANRPSAEALQSVDQPNEPPPPPALINQHQHHSPSARHQSKPMSGRKPSYSGGITTANTLVDANNQPFVPSLFRFPSQYQQPAFIHPNLGPVVYPTAQNVPQPAQPSQFYYQEAPPTPTVKRPYRSKQYNTKTSGNGSQSKTARPKEATKLQSYDYDLETQSRLQTGPIQFYNNPPDLNENKAEPTQPPRPQPPTNYSPFPLPAAAPSQSSIYVSQGTGITTPSHPIRKPSKKTAEDVRQLKLPSPGGKPLTQAEFQALVDAGYPVTAVPVPVPVPYEQYIKENPEHRSQNANYPLADLVQQYASAPQRRPAQQDRLSVAAPSEQSVQIISSHERQPKEGSATDAEAITYLRPVIQKQHRHPRNEKESEVEGKKKETQ